MMLFHFKRSEYNGIISFCAATPLGKCHGLSSHGLAKGSLVYVHAYSQSNIENQPVHLPAHPRRADRRLPTYKVDVRRLRPLERVSVRRKGYLDAVSLSARHFSERLP